MSAYRPDSSSVEGWFDKKENVQKVLYGLFGACVLIVLVDVVFWITKVEKNSYLKWEQWPGFYAIYGFVACVALVLIAKHILRPLVKRAEDYYDKENKEGDNDV